MTTLPSTEPTVWPRRRLITLLAGIAMTGLCLLAGLALAVFDAVVADTPHPTLVPAPLATDPAQPGRGEQARDAIAAEPMLPVQAADARETAAAVHLAPGIAIPDATGVGPAGVAAGFPRTPEGAVAQLAAIEVRVIEAMSIPTAHAVHQEWTMPGAGEASAWDVTQGVQAFLAASRQEASSKDETTLVQAIPAAGLVKGVDGPDWVLACVLLDVRASIVADARIGWGHCERMQWQDGRWLIAPGAAPAKAPSTWPGSQKALDVGWRTWVGE